MENITGLKILLNGTSNENKDKHGSISAPPLCAVTFLLCIILILNKKWNFVEFDNTEKNEEKKLNNFIFCFRDAIVGSMDSHGNMISHLLSQVKIGMDLTKVVLPTFILERRSLLEMYADFFAHPDIFVSIADHAEPRDRMVQVCSTWSIFVHMYQGGG